MAFVIHCLNLVLVALVLVCAAPSRDYGTDSAYSKEELPELLQYETNKENIRKMINAYRANVMKDPLLLETNALVDTKYKTWKRNADLINTLLGLPKAMHDAGRWSHYHLSVFK